MNYTWGSASMLPELLGRENPSKEPVAELWMGVHKKAPSYVVVQNQRVLLSDFVRDCPGALGSRISQVFGAVPFLFKVLAIEKPLSVQVHPNKRAAEKGYRLENALGVREQDFSRNYIDGNHKPEIITALTDFYALYGFREPGEIIEDFSRVDHIAAKEAVKVLKSRSERAGLEAFFFRIMNLKKYNIPGFIKAVLHSVHNRHSLSARWVKKIHEYFPHDPGICAPFILNLVHLKPGEALYTPAGVLHSYLQGLGVELMSNSDNVLRCFLTEKHIDTIELSRITKYWSRKPQVLPPEELSPGLSFFASPLKDFILLKGIVSEGKSVNISYDDCFRMIICTEGSLEFKFQGGGVYHVNRGESYFIPSESLPAGVFGRGVFLMASVPE